MTAPPIGVRGEGPFFIHALELTSRFCGIPLVPDLHGQVGAGAALAMPTCPPYTAATVPPVPTDRDLQGVVAPGASFPFDLFGALRFWLTDAAHDPAADALWDRHDRLMASASAQGRAGLLEIPVVNAYLQLFRAWLCAQAGREGRKNRATVVLTHDVDDPVNPSDLCHGLWVMGAATLKGRPRAALGHLRGLPRTLWAKTRGDQHWNFAEVVALEAEYGFRSAFYFAAAPWWWPGASSWDVTYDVRSPGFHRALGRLRQAGAEVGLHLSYNACDDVALMGAERARLERVTGASVLGGRHHYWHLGRRFWATLAHHGRAGLCYDTSVGFNDAAGYRLGVALPFRPFDPTTERPIDVVQIPTLLMDGNLLYDETCGEDEALRRIDGLLTQLKRYEGTAAISWHLRTAWPGAPRFERWAAVYRGLLERLAADDDVDVRLPREVYAAYGAQTP